MIHEIILIVLILASAFLAVEFREILHAIVSFLIMSILVAVVFVFMNAYYVAVLQLLIYAGAVVILLLISWHTVER